MTAGRRRFLQQGAAVGAAVLAGCLGAARRAVPGMGGSTDALSARASVGMACSGDEYFFSPDLVWIERGGTVSWGAASACRQLCTAYHPTYDRQLRIPEDAEPWQGPDTRDGTLVHTFDVEGVYDYFGLYEEFGQVGSVVVGHPDPAGQPGLSEPGPDVPEAARAKLRDLNERTRGLLD